jgi:F-type H+-transporting ATPase subunit gamma
MERLATLTARIGSVSELLEVVRAMRSLAAVRLQQASAALAGAREYARVVGGALADAIALCDSEESRGFRAMSPDRRGLLVFCSEHGFVGAFNEALLEQAERLCRDERTLFVAGTRGALAAEERGLKVAWSTTMTSRADGVGSTARRIAAELYRRFAQDEIRALDAVFARTEAAGRWRIEQQSILPIDPRAFARPSAGLPPLHNLPPQQLIDRLVEEYFFADLVRAATESLAAENAARMTAMTAARENIEKKLEELRGRERQLRQEEITTELLDVVSGSEVLLHAEGD